MWDVIANDTLTLGHMSGRLWDGPQHTHAGMCVYHVCVECVACGRENVFEYTHVYIVQLLCIYTPLYIIINLYIV